MIDEIRWGMIGCGDVAERKSAPAFNLVAHSRLAAVFCRNAGRAADYAQRHQVPRWYSRAEDLISDPQANAIYIATPPDSHMQYTLLAARAGKPVYVEKPMARTFAECQTMLESCRQAGVPLFVAYYRRVLPAFCKVKDLIEEGAIGEPRFVNIKLYHSPPPEGFDSRNLPWRVQPEISGGGLFYDLASHQLDYLDFLFGPIEKTAALSANQAGWYSPEDILTATWQHASGVLGSAVWCFTVTSAQRTDLAEIVGSRGSITFSFFEQVPIRLYGADGRVEEFTFPRCDPIQQPLIQRVVDALRGEGNCPSTGESGARANQVMELMARKTNQG